MKILLIEDDEEKMLKILEYIRTQYSDVIIKVARSFNSGLRELITGGPIDVLLLDMSMPNFNSTIDDPNGGAPEHFAGREILAQMKLRRIVIPTVVITMFDLFGESPDRMSFAQLEQQLKLLFDPNFRGMVYYNSGQEGWKNALGNLIRKITRGDL